MKDLLSVEEEEFIQNHLWPSFRQLSAALPQHHFSPMTHSCGVTLLRTGLRKSEFPNLTADCIVQIGSSQ